MPQNREFQDDSQEKDKDKEKQVDSSDALSAAARDVERSSDTKSDAAASDPFKGSYLKMHSEIFGPRLQAQITDLSSTPAWLRPPGSFPKSDATADNGKKVETRADAAKTEPSTTDASKPKDKPYDYLTSYNFSNFAQLPDLKIGKFDKSPNEKPEEKKVKPEAEDNAEFHSELEEPAAETPRTQDKAEKEQSSAEQAKAPITRDGNKIHIEYPNSTKTRDLIMGSDGRAQEIITKDQSGTMHMVRKGDQWYARVQGMELQMPGKIEANDRGEVSFEMQNGVFRREKPDGSSVQEKNLPDGSRMAFYNNNQVEKLTRKDGSSIQVSEDGKQMIETLPNSNRSITWKKTDDSNWVSDGQPAQKRSNFKVDTNGVTSWDGPDKLKFVLNGDGSLNVQGEGSAKIQLDDKNRIKSIDYGKKVREFEYFDNSNEIKKATVKDLDKNTSSSFTRDKEGSNSWRTDNGQIWNGDIKLGAGGIYSYKPEGNSVQEADKDGRWYTMWPDGKVTRDQIGNDGSRLSYSDGKLVKALSKDGTSAEISDSKISVNNPRTGERTTWTKEGESWKSDSARFPGVKKDVSINEKCEVSFTAEDGSRHSIRPDGKESITRKDGVQLELNDQQQIDRITKGNSVRNIERNADGSISRITDENKDSKRAVLDRKPGDDISSVDISKDGDISIKRKDGSSTLEQANFNSVTRDKDGSPLKVINPRGDVRTFRYDSEGANKSPVEIIDVKKGSKGDKTESWSRKSGTSNDFITLGSDGKPKVRENVKLSPDGSGEYTYKNKDGGKDRVARLGGGDGGDGALSESVEEAREGLLEELKDKLPEANFKRMETMMKNFENRMADRAYMRKLAKVKSSEFIDDETTKEVQGTYDSIRQMVATGNENTFFDQKTRVKLAENFMFNAMEPTCIDQGPASDKDPNGHGTCWIESGQIWGMTQHPGAMADYLKQVTLNGSYTTKNSGEKDAKPLTYTFSPKLLSFSGNKQESKWTIETATTEWRDEGNFKTQIWGDRSPVSKIFDYTLPILSGSRREFDVDGGLYETANLVGQGWTRGTRDIMYMVTGDFPVDRSFQDHSSGHLLNNNYTQSMLEKGTVLSYTPGHLRSQTVRRVDGKWYLIQDDQHSEDSDKIMGHITDIEAWARGDKNALNTNVNSNKIALMHKTSYVGSGNNDALGTVVPRAVNQAARTANTTQTYNAVRERSSSSVPTYKSMPRPQWSYR